MRKKFFSIILPLGVVVFILSGCFQGEQSLEEMDVPEDAEAVHSKDNKDAKEDNKDEDIEGDKETEEEDEDSETLETVPRQLYLLDANGMVVSQTLELPKEESKEVATQVLEYLVKDGPVTSLLPNGFQAVLPEGTEVLGLNLQDDGTIIVDLSEEFTEYAEENELNILQSMTYTLTQFDSVDKIKLRIDGEPQDQMPVGNTPINEGYSRSNGINLTESDTIDLIDSEAVTMFYPAEYNDNRYYIPMTQHVQERDDNMFSSIIQQLLKGPGIMSNTTHVFNDHIALVDTPKLEEGVLKLVFNQKILKDVDKSIIADEVMETLVRTLTDQPEVEAIDVIVQDMETLTNENGEAYTEPVTLDKFVPIEKL